MRTLVLFLPLLTVAMASLGQTNVPPTFYVHVGIGYGTNAEPLLCTRIRIGERIAVTNDDSCVLTGAIDKQGTNLVARNLKWWKKGGSQLSGYRGHITLEEPAFAGSAGDFLRPAWVIVSTNSDDRPGLQRLKQIEVDTHKKGRQ